MQYICYSSFRQSEIMKLPRLVKAYIHSNNDSQPLTLSMGGNTFTHVHNCTLHLTTSGHQRRLICFLRKWKVGYLFTAFEYSSIDLNTESQESNSGSLGWPGIKHRLSRPKINPIHCSSSPQKYIFQCNQLYVITRRRRNQAVTTFCGNGILNLWFARPS